MNRTPSLYFITNTTRKAALEASDCDCNCDCDCDCACPTPFESQEAHSWQACGDRMLFPAPDTRDYALDDEHWMLLGGKSSPAVMSAACFDLFRRFPARLDQAIAQTPHRWSTAKIGAVIEQMVQHGILVDVSTQQSPATQHKPSTLAAWIHLTSQCNLACRYCYLPHAAKHMAPAVGYQIVDAILRSARAHHAKTVKLKYAGGEPLLNFPTLLDNYRYATAQAQKAGIGLEGRILTNALLLDREKLQQIKAHHLSLAISLDGIGTVHDAHRPLRGGGSSFALVEKGISLALEAGLLPSISITISGANANGLPQLVNWLLDQDLPFTFNFYRANPFSHGQASLDFESHRILAALLESYTLIEDRKPDFAFWHGLADRVNLRQPHTRPCAVGQNYLAFDVEGHLASCQMAFATAMGDCHSADPLGMIRDSSIGMQNLSVTQKAGCAGCEWKLWCAGGCPALAKYVTGSHQAKSPYCEIYQAIIPVLFRLEARRLLRKQAKQGGGEKAGNFTSPV